MQSCAISPLLLLGAAALLSGAAPVGAPEAVAEGFYAVVLKYAQTGGVPNAKERGELAPFVTPTLLKALTAADGAEAVYAKKTNHEVPPLVEGDLFTSMFEGATTAKVTQCAAAGAIQNCAVALTYVDARDKSTTRWTDTAIFAKTSAGWRLDDILYGGTWDFGHKGKLSTLLRDVVLEANQE